MVSKQMENLINFIRQSRGDQVEPSVEDLRESFEQTFKKRAEELELNLVYDVCHNIAKIEEHRVNNERKKVWIHRKGATRAFPPGHEKVLADYRAVGQPVFIPGSMATNSWILVGAPKSMEVSFGSTAHGAGRTMSRSAAKRQFWGGDVKEKLEERGMVIRSASQVVLAEEAGEAYKDVNDVVRVVDGAGISEIVAKLRPLGVIKG